MRCGLPPAPLGFGTSSQELGQGVTPKGMGLVVIPALQSILSFSGFLLMGLYIT